MDRTAKLIENQMIKKHYYFGQILLAFFMVSCVHADDNDFDNVCLYFEKLDKRVDVEAMSNMQRNNFIVDMIKKNLPQTSNARAAWIAIDSAVPEVRYELFKSAAESILNKQWKCSAMLKWDLKTGEF